MKIVIDIPDNEVPKRREIVEIGLQFMDGEVCECTYPFQVLPSADEGHYDEGLSFCADKIEDRPTDVNCSHCDYWKFSRAIIHGFVDLKAAHGIESIEELEEELHRLNQSKQEDQDE